MSDERETDAELLGRHEHVKGLHEKAAGRAGRLQAGGSRDRAHLWAGCLNFTLLQIEDEMRRRARSKHNEEESDAKSET